VLLDEIEKAHPDVFNILLQVLDDGRLTDNKGRTANFKNTIVIMTSNIGSHLIQDSFEQMENEDSDKEAITAKAKNNVMELLRKQIRPEFLNRIDDIIMFTPLSRENVRDIVNLQFEGLKQTLLNQQIELNITEEALDWLSQLGYDPQYGARPLKRVMQRRILNELSKEILAGNVKKDSNILIGLDSNQQFIFENK
jgi:ATP-dependent Clp protease ATP-binding subunit ClpB